MEFGWDKFGFARAWRVFNMWACNRKGLKDCSRVKVQGVLVGCVLDRFAASGSLVFRGRFRLGLWVEYRGFG